MRMHTSIPAVARATTLIEVVVALALGVLLVTGVQTLVVRSHRTAQQFSRESDERDRQRMPLELVRQDASALPVNGSLELRDGALRMTTLCDLEGASQRVRHGVDVLYSAAHVAGELTLCRAQRELGIDAPWQRGIALADGLQSATFAVFDGQRWESTWPSPTPRPARALRITLTWSSGKTNEEVIPLAPLHWKRHDE